MVERDIYIKVIEGSEGYEPIKAEHIRDDIFRVLDENNSYDEIYNPWEFKPGDEVYCREKNLSGIGGKNMRCLVAFKKYEGKI